MSKVDPVRPEGPLAVYNNTIIDDINAYNKNHSYLSFDPSPPKNDGDASNSSIFSRTPLNLMSEDSESETKNPVKMNMLDNNYYTIDTATYNAALYFASLKAEAQANIRNKTNILTETQGLRYVIRPEYYNGDTAFFTRSHSVPTKNASIVGSGDASTAPGVVHESFGGIRDFSPFVSMAEGFGNIRKENRTAPTVEAMTSGESRKYSPGLAFVIVDGYMNDNFQFFEGKPPKAGTSPGTTANLGTVALATNNMIPNNNSVHTWSAQWTGYFRCNRTGSWTFGISSDDCGFIWINNVLVANYGGQHPQQGPATGKINLQDGVYYPMKVQMGENQGLYGINVGFYQPGTRNKITDGAGYYFSTLPYPGTSPSELPGLIDGLKVIIVDGYMNDDTNFFEGKALKPGTTYAYVSNIAAVDIATNNMIPDNSSVHEWSAQWTGYFLCTRTGTWTFSLNSDDCSFLWIADTMIINNGGLHSPKELSGSIDLVINQYYPIKLQMAEYRGGYVVRLGFAPPGGNVITDGTGYYFSKPPTLHSFNQSLIPIRSMYDHITKFFSPTAPTMHANNNEVLMIYPDLYDAAIVTSRNMKDIIIPTGTGALSVEWFGYFKPISTGTYTFESHSSRKHSSIIWFGDTALVAYNEKNAVLNNLKESATAQSTPVAVVSGQYYPIRVIYGHSSEGIYDFSVNIYMTQSSGQSQMMSSGDGYFCFLTDPKGKPYEPVQMAIALQRDQGDPATSVGAAIEPPCKCFVSPVDISNNAVNNFNLRATKAMQNVSFSRIALTTTPSTQDIACSLVLQADGNLMFHRGNDPPRSITGNKSYNANCATMCNNLQSNIGISNIAVSSANIPGVNLTGYFETVVSQGTDANDPTLVYDIVTLTLDNEAILSIYRGKLPILVTAAYTIGANSQYNVSKYVGAAENSISINNYSDMKNVGSEANNCHTSVQASCAFTMRLTNSGNLSIVTATAEVWNSSSLNIPVPDVARLKVVDAWVMDLAKRNNLTMESASYAAPFDPTPFKSSSLGPGGDIPYLYSPNGMFKLEIEKGNVVIKYAEPLNASISTSSGNPTTFFLHIIAADEKLGNMFVANETNRTLRKITPDTTGALHLNNAYTKVNTTFASPPTELHSSGVDPRSYSAYANTDLAGCQAICNSSAACTHLYSYKLPNNKAGCMVNSDSKHAKYYATTPNSGISSSELYTRGKTIASTCRFSYPEYTTGALNVINATSTPEYAKYESQYSISTDAGLPVFLPDSEGACGDANIKKKMVYLMGDDKSYATYIPSMAPVEGFDGGANTMSRRSTALPFSHLDNNAASRVSPAISSVRSGIVEGMSIAGYNPITACTVGADDGAVRTCITGLTANIAALKAYSTVYHDNNAAINRNYSNITSTADAINVAYPETNVLSPNELKTARDAQGATAHKYEAIDYAGNLIYEDKTRMPQYLKDRMLSDAKQEILIQNTTYILSTMTVAVLAIVAVMASRSA
jgi:hypothetical protein